MAIGIWCLLHWTISVGCLKFAIVLRSFYYCCEVAYVSYMFEKVSKDNFLTVSALTRAAPLAGHLMNAVLFRIILRKMNPNVYSYLALVSQIAVLVIAAIFLNFKRTQPSSVSLKSAPSDMITQVQTAFSNHLVVFYSIWYIFGFGIINQPIIFSLEDQFFRMQEAANNVSVNSEEAINALLDHSFIDLVNEFDCFIHKIADMAWHLHRDCIGFEHPLCSDVSTDDIHHSTQKEYTHLFSHSVSLYKCINHSDRQC